MCARVCVCAHWPLGALCKRVLFVIHERGRDLCARVCVCAHWPLGALCKSTHCSAAPISQAMTAPATDPEEDKYAGLPAWKVAVLKEKARKEAEANAPAEEEARRKAEHKAKVMAMPAWKRDLYIKQHGPIE